MCSTRSMTRDNPDRNILYMKPGWKEKKKKNIHEKPSHHLHSQTQLVYLSHIMRPGRVIGCNTLNRRITKPPPNPHRHVQWSTQSLTSASQPEQIGWSGSMRRISLAERLQNASIPSPLIERAMGHQPNQPSPFRKTGNSSQHDSPSSSATVQLLLKVMFGLLIVYCSKESRTRVTTASERFLFLRIHLEEGRPFSWVCWWWWWEMWLMGRSFILRHPVL